MAKRKRGGGPSGRDLIQRPHVRSAPPSPKKQKTETTAAPSRKPEPIVPFQAEDKILLVGEGDFSFSKSIVEEHGCCDVTATCLDSKQRLFEKYDPQGEDHVNYLEDEGQTVLYAVDATKLDSNKSLKVAKGPGFDVVVFNFPHVGGRSTDVNRQVRFNQELLVSFFKSASALLSPSGTIVVTLFEGEPYTLWNVRDLARHSGLEVQRSFKFSADAYPGYRHARTLGNVEGGGGWKGEEREARSYVFKVKGVVEGRKERLKAMAKADERGKKRRVESSGSESEDD